MEFDLFDLGLTDFKRAWLMQRELFAEVRNGNLKSALIICQHYPVITLGRSAKRQNILATEQKLRALKIPVYQLERGGDVTYHGPGQIIAYPIFNLTLFKKDIHLFLRQLEEVAINLLAGFGIKGLRIPGLTGVWVNSTVNHAKENYGSFSNRHIQKIASLGIAIRNWITFHGLSINIKRLDLAKFGLIKPCGLDAEVTCLETILGSDIEISSIKAMLIERFKAIFGNKL